MSLAFAGFPVATFADMGPTALVLATIRAECDSKGHCHKDQRFLAAKAGKPLGTFSYHIAKLKTRGIIVVIRASRRKKGTIIIRPEHRWVTPEKPAPARPECTRNSDTSSKASFKKEAPVAPASGGSAPPDISNLGKEGEPTPQRQSTRRTPYGQPRMPRRPRQRRQRDVKARLMEAFRIAGAARESPPAWLAIPPPAVEIIPPSEIIPFPREPRQRPRELSTPTTRMMEAFYNAGRKLAAEHRDRDFGDHRETADAFPPGG